MKRREQATGFLYIYIYIKLFTQFTNNIEDKQKCNETWYIKLNNTITEPYVLFQDAIRLLKDNRNYNKKLKKKKKESDWSIPNTHLLWLECGVIINMHIWDWKNEPY